MVPREYLPGERAPGAGRYEELNPFGAPTGKVALMKEGDELPAAPRGFVWRPLSERSAAELRAQAADYRHMAETARTADVAIGLRKIADRFDAMADQRERETRGEA